MDPVPIHLAVSFAGGFGLWLAAGAAASALRRRRKRDLEASAPLQPLLALHYGMNHRDGSRNRRDGGLPMLLSAAMLCAVGTRSGFELYLPIVIALLGLPGLHNDIRDLARKVTVAPALAAHEEGLYVSGWRRTVFVPWRDLALVYTDPPETGGYVGTEEKVTLHVEARDGRSWRFSRWDFPDDAPAAFAELAGLAALRTAPPDSMLRRERM